MISVSLKAINPSFLHKHPPFHFARKQNNLALICFCKRNDDSSSDAEPSSPEGDTQKQELLARIAMLQTEKVRLTDYLDDRSAYLTRFAEEAEAEFDKIGEDALRGLDEAGNRIMENIESQMQAFEESMEMNRVEIEKDDDKLAEFECQMERDRNEGLFFKSFTQRKQIETAKAEEQTRKIQDETKRSAGSKTRRNIYIILIGVLVTSIADAFVSATAYWWKIAVLGGILVALVTQFAYEQGMLSEGEMTENKKRGEEEK